MKDYVRALLPRLARKAGVEKRVHAHGLRHSHAAELAVEGFPVNLVQAQLVLCTYRMRQARLYKDESLHIRRLNEQIADVRRRLSLLLP